MGGVSDLKFRLSQISRLEQRKPQIEVGPSIPLRLCRKFSIERAKWNIFFSSTFLKFIRNFQKDFQSCTTNALGIL